MSGQAVLMMVVAMLVLWGGLALAMVNLRRSPETSAPGSADSTGSSGTGDHPFRDL